jgi:hypothetical protein
VTDKRKREARAIQAETGMSYTAALREADRRHAEASRPPAGSHAAAGEFLHNLLSPVSQPGPPWTHVLLPPEPIGWGEDDNPIYPEPGPTHTLTDEANGATESIR